MNRTESEIRIPAFAGAAVVDAPAHIQPGRLVVVVLHAGEEALLAGQILALARPRAMSVLLVGVAQDPARAAELRRGLVRIAAFVKDEGMYADASGQLNRAAIRVDLQVEQARDWMDRLQALLKPADLLACYEVLIAGSHQRPLHDVLSSRLKNPVYVFSGLDADRSQPRNVLGQVASWLGGLALIGGFLLLQARIVILTQGWMQSSLLIATLFVEAALIWFVNSLMGPF